MKKNSKYLSQAEALQKMQRYCAYQERSHREVRTKLIALGVYGDKQEQIIAELIAENFLNEERFAIAYANGKFRIKQWGKVRIRRGLQQQEVSEYSIRKALSLIEDSAYKETLQLVILKKKATVATQDVLTMKNKIAQYAISKGFEPNIVWEFLEGML